MKRFVSVLVAGSCLLIAGLAGCQPGGSEGEEGGNELQPGLLPGGGQEVEAAAEISPMLTGTIQTTSAFKAIEAKLGLKDVTVKFPTAFSEEGPWIHVGCEDVTLNLDAKLVLPEESTGKLAASAVLSDLKGKALYPAMPQAEGEEPTGKTLDVSINSASGYLKDDNVYVDITDPGVKSGMKSIMTDLIGGEAAEEMVSELPDKLLISDLGDIEGGMGDLSVDDEMAATIKDGIEKFIDSISDVEGSYLKAATYEDGTSAYAVQLDKAGFEKIFEMSIPEGEDIEASVAEMDKSIKAFDVKATVTADKDGRISSIAISGAVTIQPPAEEGRAESLPTEFKADITIDAFYDNITIDYPSDLADYKEPEME